MKFAFKWFGFSGNCGSNRSYIACFGVADLRAKIHANLTEEQALTGDRENQRESNAQGQNPHT
jgi:hypothetical protein